MLVPSCRIAGYLYVCTYESFHNQQKLCVWPSHFIVPFCHSCYGDGGWICQCSAMATVSRVTPECQWMKNNQYTALSKETEMRCIWRMSEVCHECADTHTHTESMCTSSSWRVHFPPSISPKSVETNQCRSLRHVHRSVVLKVCNTRLIVKYLGW